MENLDIEKFNPLKKEVLDLVENCKKTVISIKDDKSLIGYNLMKENKKLLQKKRTNVIDILKDERSFAKQYQSKVIGFEKELLGFISPLENELGDKIKAIDEEKEKIKRQELLPERKEKLQAIKDEATDEFILSLDDGQFDEYLNQMTANYLEDERLKVEEDKRKLAQAKIDAENEKQRLADLEQARQDERVKAEADRKKEIADAKEKAILAEKQAKLDKEKALADAKAKADKEKQDIIDEQNRKEKARLDAEAEAKHKKQEHIDAEKADEAKQKKNKKYKDFLARNGYSEHTKLLYYIKREGNTFTIYKEQESITI